MQLVQVRPVPKSNFCVSSVALLFTDNVFPVAQIQIMLLLKNATLCLTGQFLWGIPSYRNQSILQCTKLLKQNLQPILCSTERQITMTCYQLHNQALSFVSNTQVHKTITTLFCHPCDTIRCSKICNL